MVEAVEGVGAGARVRRSLEGEAAAVECCLGSLVEVPQEGAVEGGQPRGSWAEVLPT